MNNNQDIDKLFEAARRREADQRRQQQLSDMIDRLAEDERKAESGKRKAKGGLFWTYAGIAASVLLLASVGLHILSQDSTSPSGQPMLAENGERKAENGLFHAESADSAEKRENAENVKRKAEKVVAYPSVFPEDAESLLAEETKNGERSAEGGERKVENVEQEVENVGTYPIVRPENVESLLAEETENGEVRTENETGSNISHSTSPIVYERTSSRLVCGSGCRPEVRPSQEDSPRFAFTNISSTGTTIGVGTSTF